MPSRAGLQRSSPPLLRQETEVLAQSEQGFLLESGKGSKVARQPTPLKSASSRFPPFLEAERDLHPFVEMRCWLTLGIKTLSRKVLARTPRELRAAGRTTTIILQLDEAGNVDFAEFDRSATGTASRVFFICAISFICTVKQHRPTPAAFVRMPEAR